MAKVPKFMQNILSENKKLSDKVQEKMKGQSTLYMGDPTLQWGVGGWIRGRDNLIYGPFGSGKSSLALIAAGEEQKLTGGVVIIFDSEYNHKDPHEVGLDGKPTQDALDARVRYGQAGLNWQLLVVKRSNEVDSLFADLEQIKADLDDDPSCISAFIVDSWGGIQSENTKKAMAKGELSRAGNQFGGNAKTMGPILQELLRIAAEKVVTMFFVQHCIKNMDEYGPPYILIGGEKLKFLVHNILFVEGVTAKDANLLEGDVATTKDTVSADIIFRTGKKIRFKCEKSRNVVEGRKGEFWMNFQDLKFALPEVSLFNLAEKLGVIKHPGTLVFDDDGITPKVDKKTGQQAVKYNNLYWEFPVGAPTPDKFHGEKGMIAALKDSKDLYNRVYADCMKSNKLDAAAPTEAEEATSEKPKKQRKGQ